MIESVCQQYGVKSVHRIMRHIHGRVWNYNVNNIPLGGHKSKIGKI